MLIWIALPLDLLLACWIAYISLLPLAWLTILLRFLWFFPPRRDQYSLDTLFGRQRFDEDFSAVLERDRILNELMIIRMFPGCLYFWLQSSIDVCYRRYCGRWCLWKHPDVRARYVHRKNYCKQQRAKGQK